MRYVISITLPVELLTSQPDVVVLGLQGLPFKRVFPL